MSPSKLFRLAFLTFLLASAPLAEAGAILAGFSSGTLLPNDDGSTGLVGLGFTVDFYGLNASGVYVNNNGNVTFDVPLGTYTPFPLLTTSTPLIAPFFADVDTRNAGSPVTYGTGTVDGHDAFGVNWVDVDYYLSSGSHTLRNAFQLIIVDRSDVGSGDFDFWFNYDYIQWETGNASGGSGGLGGNSARVGWSNGTTDSFELTGSAVNGAFLDGGGNALVSHRLNSDLDGRYIFSVRNGSVEPPPTVPEPATLGLLGAGVLGLAARRRRRG